jgi:DNA-binding HxlR family transcriptional regulator
MVKRYGQFCSIARAVDVLGDRWALLVLRELLLGPRRYTDLLDGLPGIGTNVLAVRLRELEEAGIVAREKLPPPAASTVYLLTNDGDALRPIVDELARWGVRHLERPERGEALRPGWLVYSLAVCTPPTGLPRDDELELRVDDEPHTLTVRHGRFEARRGPAAHPIAVIEAPLGALFRLARGQATRGELERDGQISVENDARTARRFLDAAAGTWIQPVPAQPA